MVMCNLIMILGFLYFLTVLWPPFCRTQPEFREKLITREIRATNTVARDNFPLQLMLMIVITTRTILKHIKNLLLITLTLTTEVITITITIANSGTFCTDFML